LRDGVSGGLLSLLLDPSVKGHSDAAEIGRRAFSVDDCEKEFKKCRVGRNEILRLLEQFNISES
jgi:hypothetical protein